VEKLDKKPKKTGLNLTLRTSKISAKKA